MSTLAEIEAAAETLATEQQEELLRFLAARLRREKSSPRARLVPGPCGTLLMEAPPDAPVMNTAAVKQLLEDYP